ncbi:DUF928 domain-containing protein [Alkalinema pantanalense CENA528]|uniref:DUF928 domain-containing protein n=1 Tax=Alkalinema pantanalense TaxID=1620705 RepID=UPI003D6ECD47
MKTVVRLTAVLGVTLCLIAMLGATVDARKSRGYRPGKIGRFTGATTTTGVRGGCENGTTDLSLTAIAPMGHVGQTSLARPTLVWFVPGDASRATTAYKMELRLLQNTKEQNRPPRQLLWKDSQLSSRPGLMSLKLPDEVQLAPGETYIWQIILKCNPNKPSHDLIAEAPIQRVAVPNQLPQDRAFDGVETVGELWYDLWDGIEIASAVEDAKQLITDLTVIESESSSQQPAVEAQYQRLKKVLATLEPIANQNQR